MKKKLIIFNFLFLIILFCIFSMFDIHLVKVNNLDNVRMSASILSAINDKKDFFILENIEDDSLLDVASASVLNEVLETQVGVMSAYGPDCRGCSGHLGGGFDASLGNYIYNDATFGEVRIVAGDSKYPYGTIIRVKNSKIGEFNAIVLDRGGAIGIGKKFMFDLLFPSEAEASKFGTSYNVSFEVLRYGY